MGPIAYTAFLGIEAPAAFSERAVTCGSLDELLALASKGPALCVVHADALGGVPAVDAIDAVRDFAPTILVGKEVSAELRGAADMATPQLDPDGFAALAAETRARWQRTQTRRRHDAAQAASRVAGGIAHDLNNVLMVIMGPLEMAVPEAKGTPLADLIDMSLGGTGQAERMALRLSGFSSRGREPARHDLNHVLDQAAKALRERFGASHQLSIAQQTRPLPVFICPQRLIRVLVNLVENAADASPPGGEIFLEIADEATIVEGPTRRLLTTTRPASCAVISVRDRGEGMDPEALARAGELFYSTRDRGHTAGLGLALARAFLESGGHGLAIESRPGAGTTVHCLIRRSKVPLES